MFEKSRMFSVTVVLISLVQPSWATDPWMEKFLSARRLAFGSPKNHSTAEVKQFLILEGKPKIASVSRGKNELVIQPMAVEPVEAEPKPKKVRRKPAPKPKVNSSDKKLYSMDELLGKSRQAYESGQLDKAKRFYRLVLKADPHSEEANRRLEEINRELGN